MLSLTRRIYSATRKMSGTKASNVIMIPDDHPGYDLRVFSIPPHYAPYLDRVMLPAGLITDRTDKLAAEIYSSYPEGEPLICICILKSAMGFFIALTQALQKLNLSPLFDKSGKGGNSSVSRQFFYEYVKAQSYVDDQSSGKVNIIGMPNLSSITGQNVLIVEDMIDTGTTMKKILEVFQAYKPKTLKVTTFVLISGFHLGFNHNIACLSRLLVKRCPTGSGFNPDFLGFNIPDEFVVGFGIDYNEHFRDLDHLCVVNDKGKGRFSNHHSHSTSHKPEEY